MDEVVRVRARAIEALQDVTPPVVEDRIESRLGATPTEPAGVALASARFHGDEPVGAYQLDCACAMLHIYEGLRTTRELIIDEPWSDADSRPHDADLEVIAAEILVASAVSTLARTDAAEATVQVVREFGQYQALRDEPTPDSPGGPLEQNILELAVIVGAASVEEPADPGVIEAIAALEVGEAEPFPSIALVVEGTLLEATMEAAPYGRQVGEGVRSGAGDTD